jgi:hypothetical protein
MSILSTNLQAAGPNSRKFIITDVQVLNYYFLAIPKGPLNIPYKVAGLLDICAAGKTITVTNRILFYYKYDSKPVDCIKVFKSANAKSLGFRFLQVSALRCKLIILHF